MPLDSLLASIKLGVTKVTGVQACNDGACSRNPATLSGVTRVTTDKASPLSVTPVTPFNPSVLQPKPAPAVACTLVTPVTPKIINAESEKQDAGNIPTPLNTSEEEAIRSWLAHINETDPAEIARVVHECQTDLITRGYVQQWAGEKATKVDC